MIVDSKVTRIRANVSWVSLRVQLPRGADMEAFRGCGDIALFRLMPIRDQPCINSTTRVWETAHYFSVVGIKVLGASSASNSNLNSSSLSSSLARRGQRGVGSVDSASSGADGASDNDGGGGWSEARGDPGKPSIEVNLMIQRTRRRDGAAAALLASHGMRLT